MIRLNVLLTIIIIFIAIVSVIASLFSMPYFFNHLSSTINNSFASEYIYKSLENKLDYWKILPPRRGAWFILST